MAAKQKDKKGKGGKIIVSLVLLAIAGALFAWQFLGGGGGGLNYQSVHAVSGARLAEALAGQLSSGDSVVIIVDSEPSAFAEGARPVLEAAGLHVQSVYSVQESGPQREENMSSAAYERELVAAYKQQARGQAGVLITGDFPESVDADALGARIAAVGRPTAARARQIQQGGLVALVIGRPGVDRIDMSDKPSPEELFDRLYLVVTQDNLETLR